MTVRGQPWMWLGLSLGLCSPKPCVRAPSLPAMSDSAAAAQSGPPQTELEVISGSGSGCGHEGTTKSTGTVEAYRTGL